MASTIIASASSASLNEDNTPQTDENAELRTERVLRALLVG